MRLRFAVLASVVTAFAALAAPAVVVAAPHHNHGLTISATPNPIIAGEGVFIYGQLKDTTVGDQTIRLYHRVNPTRHFTLIGKTKTDSFGFYSFTRADGIVNTNRSWFVRGPDRAHSRTVHERVSALVSLTANKTTSDTNHPITFSGHVTPNHAFERVFLQQQIATSENGDDWKTIGSDRLGPGSNYVISHNWRRTGEDGPGVHDLRVVFRGDARNIRSESDTLTVTIQQRQAPGFSINTSAPIIPEDSAVTISGVLDMPGTTTAATPTGVTLYGHEDGQAYHPIASTVTDIVGAYSFPLSGPTAFMHNMVYQVRTTLPPLRHTAQLFEGVRDVVSITPSATTSTVGGQVTFTGTVKPDKTGHLIFLQRKGIDGDWHSVAVSFVSFNSSYSFTHTFGEPGTKMFRVRIYGGPENVGAASAPVTISVTGVAPVASLPPAS